jgi:hypothetical protein
MECRFEVYSVIFSSKGKKQRTKIIKIPRSNAIQFQLVLQHLVVLSHQRKKKKGVWRQLCECLSQATTHLPPTVNHLLLQALFI